MKTNDKQVVGTQWFDHSNFVFPPGMEITQQFFQPLEMVIGQEHLTGFLIGRNQDQKADFVFIHGANKGSKHRVLSFIKQIVDAGQTVLSYDHSGHGNSSGIEKHSSLAKRQQEAIAMISEYAKADPITLCGSSMGGYTAIKMLNHMELSK